MKIFLIGPGGVGKSTVGEILAELMNYDFIDLDEEFCKEINIGTYINTEGYESYCRKNSELFQTLLSKNSTNSIFSLSSGFLIHKDLDELTEKHKTILKEQGTTILLLPSESLEESTDIVVKRQLQRGFGLKEDREKEKFIRRYPIYKELGDIKIFSHEDPNIIAQEMKKQLSHYF